MGQYIKIDHDRLLSNRSHVIIINHTVNLWRSEFLVTDPEVPGLIPGATRFSDK
jgi:hypothetical protein